MNNNKEENYNNVFEVEINDDGIITENEENDNSNNSIDEDDDKEPNNHMGSIRNTNVIGDELIAGKVDIINGQMVKIEDVSEVVVKDLTTLSLNNKIKIYN